MKKYISAYQDLIKEELINIYGFSYNMEIESFTNDHNEDEIYIKDYSDYYEAKTLTKIDKRVIYRIILNHAKKEQQENMSRGR